MKQAEITNVFKTLGLKHKLHEPYYGPERYAKKTMRQIEPEAESEDIVTTSSSSLVEQPKEEQ